MKKPVISSVCMAVTLMATIADAQDVSPRPKPAPRAIPTPMPVPVRKPQVVRLNPHATATPMPALKPSLKPSISYSEALQRCPRNRHDRTWWRQRFTVIVLAGGGYYYWNAGYWFPAFGYDPANDYYPYEGPIYTYGNLLPDQVIINVQRALQQLGYYSGSLTGSLNSITRQAIAAYQGDAGLDVNGIVDAPTVTALGLQ